MQCPSCKKEIGAASKCPHCGASIARGGASAREAQYRPPVPTIPQALVDELRNEAVEQPAIPDGSTGLSVKTIVLTALAGLLIIGIGVVIRFVVKGG